MSDSDMAQMDNYMAQPNPLYEEKEEETITIPVELYGMLMESYKWLIALEHAGVDNWEGIDIAREIAQENITN